LELAQKEELQLDLKAKYENVTQALAAKSKKLEKLRSKYQEIKRDVEDAQSENQREREELLETIRDLSRNIQLKDMILSHFVPKVEASKVERRAYWNEDKDDWMLHEVNYTQMLA
jgi:chromosome segregation ATPase